MRRRLTMTRCFLMMSSVLYHETEYNVMVFPRLGYYYTLYVQCCSKSSISFDFGGGPK